MARTFDQKLEACQKMLEMDRIPDKARTATARLLRNNPQEPRAWLLRNRAVCLMGGAEHESPGILSDCYRRLGRNCTIDLAVEMLYDRTLGMVRQAELTNDPQLALRAIDVAVEVRELLSGVTDGQNWQLRVTYIEARAKYKAGQCFGALNLHRGAEKLWRDLGNNAVASWALVNLIFLLRTAVSHGSADDINAISTELRKRSPYTWERYGQPLMLDDRGLKWFSWQDFRR